MPHQSHCLFWFGNVIENAHINITESVQPIQNAHWAVIIQTSLCSISKRFCVLLYLRFKWLPTLQLLAPAALFLLFKALKRKSFKSYVGDSRLLVLGWVHLDAEDACTCKWTRESQQVSWNSYNAAMLQNIQVLLFVRKRYFNPSATGQLSSRLHNGGQWFLPWLQGGTIIYFIDGCHWERAACTFADFCMVAREHYNLFHIFHSWTPQTSNSHQNAHGSYLEFWVKNEGCLKWSVFND
jgi:hypothetical protein